MGSDSDLPTMAAACEQLKRFGVPFEVDIVSAHRTPDKMVTYARSAHERGVEVIIAGAGGAAHLPGMVAAMTPLPVIGVPVKTSALSVRCPRCTTHRCSHFTMGNCRSLCGLRGSTRCTVSCRCPEGCLWRPWQSATPTMLGFWPCAAHFWTHQPNVDNMPPLAPSPGRYA